VLFYISGYSERFSLAKLVQYYRSSI